MDDAYLTYLLDWLQGEELDIDPARAQEMAAGILIGLELAVRHPAYAEDAARACRESYFRRTGHDSSAAFRAQAHASSGDERTSHERLADELVQAVPLPP